MKVVPIVVPILKLALERWTRPLVLEAKSQLHRLLIALSLTATGVACVIVGLTYFASALWHGLVPILGTIGADLLFGFGYALVAAILLFCGLSVLR